MRRLLLPLLALLFAAGSTFAVRKLLVQEPVTTTVVVDAAQPVLTKAVLVAAKDLVAGSFVQADSLRWQEWPDVALAESYLERGKAQEADLIGAVVRRALPAGEPLSMASVVKPGDRGFLAVVLDPGMRAVSVPVDDASSNAGLMFAGDRVDLIVTHTLEAGGDPSGARRVSETVLTDVRVIAMGCSLKTEAEGADLLAGQVRTATLETTPADAEKVALAAELGKLSLSLRSLAQPPDGGKVVARTAARTWDLEVSPALRPENQPRSTISVVRGDKLETVSVRRGAGT
jgi:pilus assembly protein CpaB